MAWSRSTRSTRGRTAPSEGGWPRRRDSQLISRAWRGLWYRGSGPAAASRLQQVEHEAFVTLFVSSQGVPVPSVVVAGATIATTRSSSFAMRPGRARRRAGEIHDALPEFWSVVGALHRSGMIHGELTPDSFGLVSGTVSLRVLGPASLDDSRDLRQKDLAQTLVSTAVLVGIERAALAAGEELGEDGVREMLPYLQQAALSPQLRRELKSESFDMDALRSATAGVVDVEVPEVVELRRVRPQSLVTIALVALVGFARVTSLGKVDLPQLVDEIRGASTGWLVAALLIGQLPFISQAIGTRGGCPSRCRSVR